MTVETHVDNQTDDGLYCSTLRRFLEPNEVKGHERQITENRLAEGRSTALPGSVPVGVTEMKIALQSIADHVHSADCSHAPVYSKSRVEAMLPVGAFRTEDHRYYWNGKGPNPSVTTILNDVLLKHALDYHKRMKVAQVIYRNPVAFHGENGGIPEAEAIKWALSEADKERDDAARIGSSVHLLADLEARQPPGASESPVEGFQISEQEKPYLEAFRGFLAFLEARGARIVSSEHMVWSEVGYAGTYDLIVWIPQKEAPRNDGGSLWLVDIKTSRKGPYPDWALQLAAYGHADQIILEGNPTAYPMPDIDRYAVLHLRPDAYPGSGWKLWEYPLTDEDFYRFVSVLDLYLWRKEDRYNKRNLIPVT